MKRRALLAALLALGACSRHPPGGSLEPPPSSVVVLADTQVLKVGGIGIEDRQEASYVLVEAENRSAEPRLVSLEGVLLGKDGEELGPLWIDELYMPAGARRTFALVATEVQPASRSARIWVRYAPVARDPAMVEIVDVKVARQGIALGCGVTLQSKVAKQSIATTFCTFYDKDGQILARPFKIIGLMPEASRSWTFSGPPEAVRATPFLGQIVY
jgi:hypothetical protein